MTSYDVYEAKKIFLDIIDRIIDGKEDSVVLQRNGIPVAKVIPYKEDSRSGLFGCGNNLFTIPDNFDDLDITTDFEKDVL